MTKSDYIDHYMKRFIYLILMVYCMSIHAMAPKLNWDNAIDRAIKKYGLRAELQLKTYFANAHVHYPPKEIALLAFKDERNVELWAREADMKWTHIHNYPLTAYSGHLGPKLRVNDRQIPEGVYRLVNFNPYSSMHLSMMINYPNSFDKEKGSKDGRRDLGNNIFIHGKDLSVGCLAIGDFAIDQLFVLARRVGLNNTQVIISPNDLRSKKPPTTSLDQPRWVPELYREIEKSLKPFNKTKLTA